MHNSAFDINIVYDKWCIIHDTETQNISNKFFQIVYLTIYTNFRKWLAEYQNEMSKPLKITILLIINSNK